MKRDTYPAQACTEPAVYWAPGTTASSSGRTTPAAPVKVLVRWQDAQERFVTALGEDAVSTAIVYCGSPLGHGGWLWRGDLTDLPSGATAQAVGTRIRASGSSPRLRKPGALYKAYL